MVAGIFKSVEILPNFYTKLPEAKHIILSDGASPDNTVAVARELRPETLVITNETDPGVPANYNQCIKAARTEYVLQINPDAEIHTPALVRLVRILDENPNAAGAAPLLIQGHEGKTFPEVDVMGPGEHLHHKIAKLPEGPFCTWFVTGAVVLWRKVAFEDFGYLDENFFFYGDDLDICVRATRKGWSLILDPGVTARHVGAASSGGLNIQSRWRKTWNMTWAHLRTIYKYEGKEAARRVAREIINQNKWTKFKYRLLLNRSKAAPAAARVDAASRYLCGGPWWGKAHLPQRDEARDV